MGISHLGVVSSGEGRTAAVAQKNLADTVGCHVQSVVRQIAVVRVQHDQMDRYAAHTRISAWSLGLAMSKISERFAGAKQALERVAGGMIWQAHALICVT